MAATPPPSSPAAPEPFWKRSIVPVVLLIIACVLAVRYADKAAEDRSAFVRWRPQIQALVAEKQNVYEAAFEAHDEGGEIDPDLAYPNPPLLAIVLYPLTLLPPVAGAVTFFMIKAVLVWWLFDWANRLAAGRGWAMPTWATAVVFILSLRPILGDLDHGNVNILIAFLIAASLWLFAHNRDAWAGLTMALATAFKVTPALFLVYFAWKRQWRYLAASAAGLVLFFLVIPGAVLGPVRNVELLGDWYRAMIVPYAVHGQVETLQHNQSMPGLIYRWLTPSPGVELRGRQQHAVNVADVDREVLRWVVRGLSVTTILLLAWLCRTPTTNRMDWRLACEYGLVVIAMLALSERTWKHHYTPIVIPFAAVVAHWALRATGRMRIALPAVLIGAFLLMATTSTELGGWMAADGQGHKYAQAVGAFLWAGLLVFAALAVILVRNRGASARVLSSDAPAGEVSAAP